jgi:hypothetical protein
MGVLCKTNSHKTWDRHQANVQQLMATLFCKKHAFALCYLAVMQGALNTEVCSASWRLSTNRRHITLLPSGNLVLTPRLQSQCGLQ